MAAFQFTRATKSKARLRLALIGPAGSGKTYTALRLASALGSRVALLDTEHGSASHYAHKFAFDTLELDTYAPAVYVQAIQAAEAAGYEVLVVDSLSHAWAGKGGALEMVDNYARRSQSGNTFGAWRDVTPEHNKLVEAMLGAKMHLIVTLRTKTEYVVEADPRTHKTTVRKVGLQPVQRDGLEYEFDVVGDMTLENDLIVTKTRCEALTGQTIQKPGDELAATLKAWLGAGESAPPAGPAAAPSALVHVRPAPPAPTTAPSAPAGSLEAIFAEGGPTQPTGGALATPNQVRAIYMTGRNQAGLDEAQIDFRAMDLYGAPPAELTRKQASDFITALKAADTTNGSRNGNGSHAQAAPITRQPVPDERPQPSLDAYRASYLHLAGIARALGYDVAALEGHESTTAIATLGRAVKALLAEWYGQPEPPINVKDYWERVWKQGLDSGTDTRGLALYQDRLKHSEQCQRLAALVERVAQTLQAQNEEPADEVQGEPAPIDEDAPEAAEVSSGTK